MVAAKPARGACPSADDLSNGEGGFYAEHRVVAKNTTKRESSPKSGRKPKKAEPATKGVDTPGVVAGLTVHPTRRLLPPPAGVFLEALAVSIRDGGLLEPVVVDTAGLLIDGFARAQAWSAINPTKPVPKRTENVVDPAAYILATWIREERTPAQRALAASRLMPQMRAEAKERQRKAGGAHPQKIAGAGLATQHAAAAVGTNRQYVNDALKLLENAPDVVAVIDSGRIATIPQALRISEQPKKKRRESLRRIASGESPDVVVRIKPLSASDRWLTPRYIVKAIQGVFGGKIALDPATEPNNPTSATAFCYNDGPTSGLDIPWVDKTFCNPPFSAPDAWIQKALAEHNESQRSGNPKRILLLLPVHPDSVNQQELFNAALDVLFLDSRIAFGGVDSDGNVNWDSSGRNAHMLVGLGISVLDLKEAGLRGTVVRPDQSHSPLTEEQLAVLAALPPWEGPTADDLAYGERLAKSEKKERERLTTVREAVEKDAPMRRDEVQ